MTTTIEPIVVKFDRPRRQYFLPDGTEVPGVTTVLGILAKPALIPWAAKMAREGKDWQEERDRAARFGTLVHAMIQAWLTGRELVPDEELVSYAYEVGASATAATQQFVTWWKAEDFCLLKSEFSMVSEVLMVGGTADIIAKRPTGERVLMDVKTGGIWPEARLQVGGYSLMWNLSEESLIDEAILVHLPRDGGPLTPHLVAGDDLNQSKDAFGKLCGFYPKWKEMTG